MSDFILSKIDGHVGVCTLNRPEVLNALNIELMDQLIARLEAFDKDKNIHVIVIAGSERAFAAGADIGEMADASVVDMSERNNLARWKRVAAVRKPIIAAVSGFALGGGCELAMHCDMIVASESAQFGQPEIKIGVIPGAGGTQRLTRAIGKFRAMEMILTGRFMSAQEAFDAGLVTKVVSKEQFLDEAMQLAHTIASMPPLALKAGKEAVLAVDEMTLSAGLEFERKAFYALFATEDQKEGMKAFTEKRKPDFRQFRLRNKQMVEEYLNGVDAGASGG
ncbi:MAG: enoyl-CoA hydratase/isomerase family protein [Planctomycetes bacterium]|nr:enoyl-CoA hydratase/isomerase family protein [Planctomycetota bacterium]